MIILSNAFSINMLSKESYVHFEKTTLADVITILNMTDWKSAIGHQDIANILSSLLGITIPVNRTNVQLDDKTVLIVAQYTGDRLPEGTTTLPENVTIQFWKVYTV